MRSLPKNYILALVIFLALLLWIGSGFFKSETNDNIESAGINNVEEKISVRATNIVGEDKTYYLTVRGRTEAEKRVMLRPKTTSTVLYTIKKGSFVKKGEKICSLDPENRSARLIEAEAGRRQAQLQYDAIKELYNEGYRSENALATAEAVLKGAMAREEIAQNELNNIIITSPFDGFIEDVFVEIGDLMTPASTCAVLLQLNPMIVSGEVTEKNVTQVSIGEDIRISFLNNEEISGKLTYVSKSSNPSTRTYKIEASFENKDADVREGLTANIKIPLQDVKAHLVPSYLLSLDDDGNLGLKIIQDDAVKFILIEIIEDSSEGLWVKGLPANTTLITVGQEYVIDGQKVEVEMINAQ
jgi:multidrug efflux system membrane fusion protein